MGKVNQDITSKPIKKKFILLDQDENIVATLIDETLTKAWASDHKKGAVKYNEVSYSH